SASAVYSQESLKQITEKEMANDNAYDNSRVPNFYCLCINNGEICPYPKKLLTSFITSEYDIKDSCKSATCRESMIDIFKEELEKDSNMTYEERAKIYNNEEDVSLLDEEFENEFYKKMLTYLQSKECSSQAKDDKATAKYIVPENFDSTKVGKDSNSSASKDSKSDASIIKCTSGILFTTLGLMGKY
ncbi:hypothetical protein PIROE2DRAFT_4823, partial [Piromyces sp. E2]